MKSLLTFALTAVFAHGQYYKTETIPLPKGEIIEVSAIALLPEKKVAIGDRRGTIWIGTGLYDDDLSRVSWSCFARGLHEPFGMFWRDGSLVVQQRTELTKIMDVNGDGKADDFENLCDDWGSSQDYHEFVFGADPDVNGDTWAVLCLTGSAGSKSDWRGWAMRITPDGKMHPEVSGIRSPGGVGYNPQGDLFYTDNQGLWNGSSSLKWLKPGGFMGNPSGNVTAKKFGLPEPPNPESGSRIQIEREKDPRLVPPAVVFPHALVGQSPTAVVPDLTEGKFGPFEKQVYVGEQTHSEVQRVDLEMVNGFYQGAVFKMIDGYSSGVVPMRLADDGTLFVGGTNRGWGSRGPQPFSLERTRWTGVMPFEVKTMRVTPTGFKLTFTEPVDQVSAGRVSSYEMKAWTYIYQKSYGSPEVDQVTPKIVSAKVSGDGLGVELVVEGWVQGHVHHLNSKGVTSVDGKPLVHPDAYYTLNEIPAASKE
ncbi:hypothetical protein V2O64_20495 [Verrucomicrobiaceae bacterium 227]